MIAGDSIKWSHMLSIRSLFRTVLVLVAIIGLVGGIRHYQSARNLADRAVAVGRIPVTLIDPWEVCWIVTPTVEGHSVLRAVLRSQNEPVFPADFGSPRRYPPSHPSVIMHLEDIRRRAGLDDAERAFEAYLVTGHRGIFFVVHMESGWYLYYQE